jgi:hypothetical protein
MEASLSERYETKFDFNLTKRGAIHHVVKSSLASYVDKIMLVYLD